MNVSRTLRLAAAFSLLVLLNYTLRPLLGWRTPIDFLVIALLLAAVRIRPGAAAVLGCGIGLAADSMAPASFGWGALAMTAVAYSASWLKAIFFADNLAFNALFLALGKWVYDAIFLLGERRLGGADLAMQLFLWSPLSAAVTAIAGVVLLLVFRPLLESSPA